MPFVTSALVPGDIVTMLTGSSAPMTWPPDGQRLPHERMFTHYPTPGELSLVISTTRPHGVIVLTTRHGTWWCPVFALERVVCHVV